MTPLWGGRALALKAAGEPVEIVWNQAIIDESYWVMTRGAPHPKAAYEFLNFFFADRPQAHLAFGKQVGYDTPHAKAVDQIPVAERPLHSIFLRETMLRFDPRWVAANRARLLEMWNAWLAK